ncbi:MAG TPA: VWA domain-containing protein [Bryobacteraceae bacterium]|jgi:VWFA-related protein|nr:VWA domain-containing protein [Bryobacteraceae bacterium]
MRNAGVVSFLFAMSVAGVPGRAQDAVPPPAQPTIRVTTNEVALDIVVRDKKGREVKNVKPTDLAVYDDGVKQQFLSFRIVSGRDLERRKDKNATAPDANPATSLPLRELNTICIVFHNIDPINRPHAVAIVKEFIGSNLPPDSYIGIFNLNEKLDVVHEFTKDRQALLAAALDSGALNFQKASVALLTASPSLTTLNVQASQAAPGAGATMDTTGGELNMNVLMGADVSNGAGASRLRGDQVREQADFGNITGMEETDRISAMIKQVGTLPGRKTILLVSSGLVTTGDPDIFQKLLTNANAHGITFYALDSTEMSAMYDTAQGSKNAMGQLAKVSAQQGKSATATAGQMRENVHEGDDTINTVRTSDSQSHLRELAEGTGGFLIANTNDFRKPFQQLVGDLETHYEAVYNPGSLKFDGRFRRIEVKANRTDWQVESRLGYFAMPDLKGSGPLTASEFTALAVLNATKKPHSFDFHLAAYHFHAPGAANATAEIALELPSSKLGASADPAHKMHRFDISMLTLVRDSNGEVVDKYSLEKPYFIPDANLAAARADQLTYTHSLNLSPGKYTVEAAVVDHEGPQATSEITSFEIPEPPKGVAISSLAMVQNLDPAKADAADPFVIRDKRVVPMVDAAVSPSAKRWIYFVVYQDKASQVKPQIHIQFKNGGQVVADQMSPLPAADRNGAIAMLLAAPTRPGACELQITAVQGSQSASEHISYVGKTQ